MTPHCSDTFRILFLPMLLSTSRTTLAVAGVGRRAASSLALKYANATFSAALSKSPQTLNKVQTELTYLATTLKQSPELDTFVKNPTLSAKERASGLTALYAKVEGSGLKKEPVSEITKNLFNLLSENGRLGETQGVIEGFQELVAKHRGELTVVVTSATPLTAVTLSRLETSLKQSQTALQAKTLKVTNKVHFCCTPLGFFSELFLSRSTLLF